MDPKNTKSKLHGINSMIQNIKVSREDLRKIRNEHLCQELENAKIQTKKTGRIATDIHPTKGDVVLIRDEDKSEYDKYGVIAVIPSPQTI